MLLGEKPIIFEIINFTLCCHKIIGSTPCRSDYLFTSNDAKRETKWQMTRESHVRQVDMLGARHSVQTETDGAR